MEEVIEGKDYSFPTEERKVLEFWGRVDAFQEQLRRTEGQPEFVFYDGPPFATGLPHYGHLLAGSLKVPELWSAHSCATRYNQAVCSNRWWWSRAGHCDPLCQPDGLPCHAPLWLGHARLARRI